MELDRSEQLADLLNALFRSSAELSRFLVLAGLDADVTRDLSRSDKASSKSVDTYAVARALVGRDLVDGEFFEALERRSPERAVDIRKVAETFRTPDPYPVPHLGLDTASGDEPSPYTDFAARLSATLDELPATEVGDQALDPDHWPWTAAASVLGSFAPLDLHPVQPLPSTDSLTALRDLVTANHHGLWVLRDEPRSACLQRLVGSGQIQVALDANRHVADRRRDLIGDLMQGSPYLQLPLMDRDELVDLDTVLGWLAPHVSWLPVSRTDVRAAAERRLLIDPLRSLVGTHFRGRTEELGLLRAHLDGRTGDQVLLLRGAGGSGKSTLLGHVILELEQRNSDDRVSFAYVDFDKTRHDPRNTTGLLRALAQQLRLLYATSSGAEDFAALESAYGGTDAARVADVLEIDVDADHEVLLDTLTGRLLARQDGRPLGEGEPPLLLFLDTFEEVVGEGPGAVQDVAALVGSLLERLPGMRVVVTGRSVPTTFAGRCVHRELGDLDRAAADAVLDHLGVREPAVRTLIYDGFGGNPLTLHLAAGAHLRAGGDADALHGVVPQSRTLSDAALEQVQGMLYSRILGHIKDPEVASVAHPGLAVRVVTIDVLRHVIAGPCGIDPARIDAVFDKLQREMSLFEVQADGALRHRSDVRRIMLRAMSDDPRRGPEVAAIHRGAVSYYQQQKGLPARTEELYHRLMSDEDPRTLDPLWSDAMIASLSSVLDEPLPARARRWLERRVDLGATVDETTEWEQEDWEANAHSRASSWLASMDPTSALSVLHERDTRLASSRLPALEVAAYLQLGQLDQASASLEEGLRLNRYGTDHHVSLALS
jgi:hypothetical protein